MKTEKEKKLQTSTEIVLTFTPVSSDEIFLIQVGKRRKIFALKHFSNRLIRKWKKQLNIWYLPTPRVTILEIKFAKKGEISQPIFFYLLRDFSEKNRNRKFWPFSQIRNEWNYCSLHSFNYIKDRTTYGYRPERGVLLLRNERTN